MGIYLSRPKTTKLSEDGKCEGECSIRFGVSAMQGWRTHMEDAHLADPNYLVDNFVPMCVFGVFDGHGGPAVSTWVSANFKPIFRDELVQLFLANNDTTFASTVRHLDMHVSLICEALRRAFMRLDVEMDSPANREILKSIHLEAQEKKREEDLEDAKLQENPSSFLDALVSRFKFHQGQSQIIEVGGQRYITELIEPALEEDHTNAHGKNSSGTGSTTSLMSEYIENPMSENNNQMENPADYDMLNASEITDLRGTDPSAQNGIHDLSESENVTNDVKPQHCENRNQGGKAPELLILQKTDEGSFADPKESAEGDDSNSASLIQSDKNITSNSHDDVSSSRAINDTAVDDSPDSPSEPNVCLASGDCPEACGSTAVVVTVLPRTPKNPPYLIIANAGDSRAVLSRAGHAIALSKDHKPTLKGESRRISRAGGKVIAGRVDGNLNLSRAVGDLYYKGNKLLDPEEQKIVAAPDIRIVQLVDDDEFVIIACDGIWDCFTNQDAVDFVHRSFQKSQASDPLSLSQICERMCDASISENPMDSEGGIGCDNMTVMIVTLKTCIEKNFACHECKELDIEDISDYYGTYLKEDFEEASSDLSNDDN